MNPRLLVVAIFCASFHPAIRADMQLTWQVEQITDSPASEMPKRAASHDTHCYTVEVTLGHDYVVAKDDGFIRAWDFARRRYAVASIVDHRCSETSLYSDLGFRLAEFQNRLMLEKMMAAGGIKENPFDRVLLEHLFSLRAPESKPLVPSPASPGQLSYTSSGKPLFSCSTDGESLTREEAAEFVRFIRYAYAMHPDILEKIASLRRIPNLFTVWRYNGYTKDQFTFTLRHRAQVERQLEKAVRFEGFSRSNDELGSLCENAAHIDVVEFKRRTSSLHEAALTDGRKGRWLDCLLGITEYQLCTGTAPVDEIKAFKDGLSSDAYTAAVVASLQPKDKEAAARSVETLRKLEPETSHPQVMKIYEANNSTAAGKPAEAMKLFQEALRANPCIVGAWKDLGDLYFQAYQAGEAWQCWDTGRRFVRSHPQFEQVNKFEAEMLATHPEFF